MNLKELNAAVMIGMALNKFFKDDYVISAE